MGLLMRYYIEVKVWRKSVDEIVNGRRKRLDVIVM